MKFAVFLKLAGTVIINFVLKLWNTPSRGCAIEKYKTSVAISDSSHRLDTFVYLTARTNMLVALETFINHEQVKGHHVVNLVCNDLPSGAVQTLEKDKFGYFFFSERF